ncbi:MAG: GtrA family protein [Pseudohongiellaceae bacterium]|jgi:putative flippase GtrA
MAAAADNETTMSALHLAFRYTLFAALATIINLLGQALIMAVYHGSHGLYLAMAVGTVAGLLTKYVLDKYFIFAQRSALGTADIRRLWLYTLTGGFTTALFWGFELGFEYWYGTPQARYLGAVIGLSLGYAIKYRLDKRFVFTAQDNQQNN